MVFMYGVLKPRGNSCWLARSLSASCSSNSAVRSGPCVSSASSTTDCMELESLLPVIRLAAALAREPRTSFLVLIVVLTSKMCCRMKLKGWLRPRSERQIKPKTPCGRQRNHAHRSAISRSQMWGLLVKMHQPPTSTHQRTTKPQVSTALRDSFESWSVELLWTLGLGIWSLPA
jgi:hypothetical protein